MTNALAILERAGFSHGKLQPDNIFQFDGNKDSRNYKLGEFNYVIEIDILKE